MIKSNEEYQAILHNMVQIGGAKYHCVQRAHILADIA